MTPEVKEITIDTANAIVRGETMVPVCNVGPLLEYIEELENKLRRAQADE